MKHWKNYDAGFKVLALLHIILSITLFPFGLFYIQSFPYLIAACLFLLGIGVRMFKLGRSCSAHVLKVHKLLIAMEILFGCYGAYAITVHQEGNAMGMMAGMGQLIVGLALLLGSLSLITVTYLSHD